MSGASITSLLSHRLVLLRLDGRAEVIELSRGHISDVLGKGLLGVGLGSVMELVAEVLEKALSVMRSITAMQSTREHSLVFRVGS